ncbi:MAG: glycosyltransferase family 4 protein [Clostridia bacterium]|nr:glycosyltransferase family 4 protein [Clostridia bacterium]
MRLGILVTIVSGFGKKGFYHSQEIGLGKALVARGHQVTIYKCVAKDKPADRQTIAEGIEIRYIPVPALGVHGMLRAGEIDPRLDGLLLFADTQLFLPHIERFCRRHGIAFVPYIGIAHSAQRNFKSRLMDIAFALGTLRIYKRLPVIAKSKAVQEELRALGAADCTIAPVGLDESELKTDYAAHDRSALRARYGYGPDDVIVSFVGRLKPEKHPVEVVELFARACQRKPMKLLMVGEGYLKEKVEARAAELGVADRVQLIERVPYENMWEIHWIADFFLNLCTREIFGMALMEAVYYRSSAAAFHAPGPDAILTGMAGHYLCDTFDQAADWVCGDKPDDAVLAESSRALIERFSWRICADHFIQLTQEARDDQKKA